MTCPTILIVADGPQIRRMMLSTLTAEGYSVVDVRSGDDALQRLQDARPDLILLELSPLGRPELDVCRTLHRRSDSPIIVLATTDTERDKVMALDAGADDYVVKPFGIQEVLARIRAVLRRVGSTKSAPTFECSELKIDFSRRVVFVRGKQIRLTPTEFELLGLLVANQGRPSVTAGSFRPSGDQTMEKKRNTFESLLVSSERKLSLIPASLGLFVPNPGWDIASNPRQCNKAKAKFSRLTRLLGIQTLRHRPLTECALNKIHGLLHCCTGRCRLGECV